VSVVAAVSCSTGPTRLSGTDCMAVVSRFAPPSRNALTYQRGPNPLRLRRRRNASMVGGAAGSAGGGPDPGGGGPFNKHYPRQRPVGVGLGFGEKQARVVD
jgi:hypothetical protein